MGKDPIREYILNTVKTWLPVRAVFTVVFAGLAFIGETVYLCLHGFGSHAAAAVLHLVFMLAALVCFLIVHRLFGKLAWIRIENAGSEKDPAEET